MKPKEKIGEKVCGDGIGKHHFDEVGISPPSGDERECVFRGVAVYSPDEKHRIIVKGIGYGINRYLFGQRLLKMALDSGCELYDQHYAINPIVDGSFVKGIVVKDRNGVKKKFYSKITIDASGATAVLRTRLPENFWVYERLRKEDINATYRVIYEVDEKQDTTYAKIYLSKKYAPGGYWWNFPKKDYVVNVGLGVQPVKNAPNPRKNFEKYIASRREFRNARIIHAGGGIVPTRKPLFTMVWNGFIAIGDAAYTCNPIHGGGIGPSMLGGKLAAETIVEAFEKDNPESMDNLWIFNKKYMEKYGVKQASLDILRMLLQRFSDEELNFIFEKKIVSGEEVEAIGYEGEIELSVIKKIGKALSLLSKPSLLRRVVKVREYMKIIEKLYHNYPETPSKFLEWRNKVNNIYKEYITKVLE
ncbi:MAG TPA: geranylgeranyl reductase family protein [Thermoprotei archaeon]|nr:geranylgeranyl reductase family protein [Thermoprotei archaeon]